VKNRSVVFSDTPVSSNKTDCYDITEIFLTVALHNIPLTYMWKTLE